MFSFIIRAPEGHCNRECISVARFLSSEIVIPFILFTHLMTVSQDFVLGVSKQMHEMQFSLPLGSSLFSGDRNKFLQRNG